MSIAQAIPTSQRSTVPADVLLEQGRTGSARAADVQEISSRETSDAGVAQLPWMVGTGGDPSASWLVSPSATRPGSGAGYAAAVTASATASASKSKAPAAPKITGEWSFLTDTSLSVEEKLARFMAAVQKKLDGELTQKMEDYKAKYGEGGTETQKDDGGFFGTLLKILCPPLAIADSIFGGVDEFLKDALQVLGGPLLAALATAVGLPMLAPAALALGQGLGAMLEGGKTPAKAPPKKIDTKTTDTKTTDAKTTNAKAPAKKTDPKTTPAKGEAGSPDERLEMLEIQRLVDKQNQMFTLVSNVMKNMHETTMVAIQNVR